MLLSEIVEILYFFGESFVLSFISLIYLGIKPLKKQLALFTIIFGFFMVIIRLIVLPIMKAPEGSHIIILFLVNIFLLSVIFDLTFLGGIICDVLYFSTIMFIENFAFIIFKLLGYSPASVLTSPLYMSIFRCVNLLVICILIYIMSKSGFILLPIKKFIRLKRNEN